MRLLDQISYDKLKLKATILIGALIGLTVLSVITFTCYSVILSTQKAITLKIRSTADSLRTGTDITQQDL